MGNACCADKPVDSSDTAVVKQQYLTDEKPDDVKVGAGAYARLPDVVAYAEQKPAKVVIQAPPTPYFKIEVDRTTGTELGIDANFKDGQTLLVEKVTGGLFQDWNDNHPDLTVKPGYRIIEVNGIKQSTKKMIAECKKKKMLEITVLRG